MIKQKSQLGFAHIAIITIILSITTIGALGYIYYQNVIQKKDVAAKKDTSTPEKTDNTPAAETGETTNNQPTNETNTGSRFTFDYPDSDFYILKNDTFNGNSKKDCVSLETADYKSGPMGPEAGASIGVCEFELEGFANIKAILDDYKNKNMIVDLSSITVDGQIAYIYGSSYEREYHNILFEKNGKNYQVMLSGSIEKYGEIYYMVHSTLKVK